MKTRLMNYVANQKLKDENHEEANATDEGKILIKSLKTKNQQLSEVIEKIKSEKEELSQTVEVDFKKISDENLELNKKLKNIFYEKKDLEEGFKVKVEECKKLRELGRKWKSQANYFEKKKDCGEELTEQTKIVEAQTAELKNAKNKLSKLETENEMKIEETKELREIGKNWMAKANELKKELNEIRQKSENQANDDLKELIVANQKLKKENVQLLKQVDTRDDGENLIQSLKAKNHQLCEDLEKTVAEKQHLS